MTQQIGKFGMVAFLVLGLIGCGAEDATNAPVANAPKTIFVTTKKPAEAIPVGQARKTIKDGQEVAVTGRIGGSAKPFVKGLAAFTIVDPQVPHCTAEEGCPTPWDYCCAQAEVKDNIATVKVVNDSGDPVTADARQLLGVEGLSLVTVHGTAQRDEHGNLSILADKVFVQ